MKTALQPRLRAALAAVTTVLLVGSGLSLGAVSASAADGDVTAATMSWGFKQSFRNYIAGPIAHGKWTLTGNVTDAVPFSWTGGAGTADAEEGSVAYDGGIHFQGHEDGAGGWLLDMDLSNVRVERISADDAVIILDIRTNSLEDPSKFVEAQDLEFATVDLSAATETSVTGVVSFTGAPTAITAAGNAILPNYATGSALDPLSFSWPVETTVDPDPGTDPDPDPDQPATPKVTVSKKSGLDRAGETITITGKNFVPNGTETNAVTPPLAGKFGGVYVAFGKYSRNWKPSAGAASTERVNGDVAWAVDAADLATVGGTDAGAVAIDADGSFEVTLEVAPGFAGEPATGTYGIYTYGGGGSAYAPFETATTVRFAEVAATSVKLTASAKKVVAGKTVALTAKVSPAVAGTLTITRGTTELTRSTSSSVTVRTAKLSVGDHDYTATFTPANPVLHSGSSDSLSVLGTKKPVVGAGSLDWGVKQSFREYVTGTIAKGSISTSGATSSGGVFGFGQASGGIYSASTGVGTSKYSGSVRFSGHGGILDIKLSDPVVRIDSATSATLLVRVNGGAAKAFATLDLAAGSKSTPNGTVRYAGVPAALTFDGADVFSYNGSSFYAAGEALDPVTFVIGRAKASGGGTSTVASFPKKNTADATAPSATGITVEGADTLTAGDELTATADGFEPNEKGILVVVYSDPVVLADDATADAAGVVSWTGKLPAALAGKHTLTFQGSVDRGISLDIAAAMVTTTAASCLVSDAAITWGFKESFRSYISGSIANGEWTVADGATYEVPSFGFPGGTGSYDGATGTGELTFPGSINFTGHGGILNTTVSNPVVRFDGDTAILSLDVAGTTQEGEEIDSPGIEFVTLDLAAATTTTEAGVTTITDAPASLTPAGAAAFGTYETGEEFDPVTIQITADAACAVSEPVVTPSATPEPVVAAEPAASAVPVWAIAIIALLALLLVAAIVLIVLLAKRTRKAA